MMRLPILRLHIDFNIARARFFLTKLQHGPAKIGTRSVIPETGMQHAHWPSIDGAEFVPAEALVVPDVLQELLWRVSGIAFAQEGPSFLLRAPLAIKVRLENGHG